MAKKARRGEKTAAVHDYMIAHPEAMPAEVAATLSELGIKITAGHVSTIKGNLKRSGTAKTVAKKRAAKKAPAVAATPAAPPIVEKPTTNGGMITLDQVKKVAQTIQTLGGYQRVTEVLEVIKELGGVKKFKDLAEAISATSADAVPF